MSVLKKKSIFLKLACNPSTCKIPWYERRSQFNLLFGKVRVSTQKLEIDDPKLPRKIFLGAITRNDKPL